MPATAQALASSPFASNGGRLVSTDGRPLALERTSLTAEARAGLARVVIEQRFSNGYDEPLAVTYTLPLPADAALSGFEFTIGDRRVVGEVDRRATARERFEEAVLSGHTAALVEEQRSSLFTQEIGNVPPHTSVVARLTVDQPLAWLADGSWEWRFPTVVAPRYLGAEARVPDAGRVTVDVSATPLPATLALALTIGDTLRDGGHVTSPSQSIEVTARPGGLAVGLAAGVIVPNCDLVVRWPVARPDVGTDLIVARPAAGHPGADASYGLLTVVPPEPTHAPAPAARDLIVLLDTSGSMQGAPLAHAVEVATHLIDGLGDADTLELIAFGSSPERWRPGAERATAVRRAEARVWLSARRASGGTEMLDAVAAALAPLRGDGQRQVVLITDGLIGFEQEIVRHLLDHLPPRSRLHAVGVGEATNRSLTAALARVGRGTEIVVGLGDDPAAVGERLAACTRAPLLTDLTLAGGALIATAPERLPDVYAGAPARITLRLRCEGGRLEVTGRAGGERWHREIVVPALELATGSAAIWTRHARERAEDLEMRGCGGERVDDAIERTGLDFQIATRLTSWVAVSETPTVDPRLPIRRERIAQALPAGCSIDGFGLRGAAEDMNLYSLSFVDKLSATAPPSRRTLGGAFLGATKERAGWAKLGGALRGTARPSHPAAARTPGVARWLPGGTLVVEVTVEGEPLTFPHPMTMTVTVRFADGRERRALVDATRTTQAGSYPPGQTLRLVVTVIDPPGDHPPVAEVMIGDHGSVPGLRVTC